jgi:hypothetical protein
MIGFYIGSKSDDYLEFYCSKHDTTCHLEYKGFDPGVPFVELTCPTCKQPKQFKLDGPFTSGFEPKKKRHTRRRS